MISRVFGLFTNLCVAEIVNWIGAQVGHWITGLFRPRPTSLFSSENTRDRSTAHTGTYQFTKATFARAIIDHSTLNAGIRAQLLAGWTPSPGTAVYIGYNDDLNYNGLHPFTRAIVPGFRRNSRTFFIKMSYLIRKSFGG